MIPGIQFDFRFIGKYKPPMEEHIPTEEELAKQEKRHQKLVKQCEANQRWYAKKKAEGESAEPAQRKIKTA